MDPNSGRVEAEQCLGISVKLLTTRDFHGSQKYAIRARLSDPNNTLPDQILAVVETLLAGETRVNQSQHPDWYSVLRLPRLVRDSDLIADHYRRLLVILNPETNRLPFCDYALKLVMDGWSILSDPNKKWVFDNELTVFIQSQQQPPQPQPQQQSVESVAGDSHVNIFQFLQQPSVQPVQQPPSSIAAVAVPTWQQPQQPPQVQPQLLHQQNINDNRHHQHHNIINTNINNNQLNQIEFMQPQQPLPPQPVAQWQKRDPTPPLVADTMPVSSNNVNLVGNNHVNAEFTNDNNAGNNEIVDADRDTESNINENDCEEVEDERVESFWTSCPYCLYTYEYQKVYQDCTLRCCNCRRGFHAAQIPNTPPINKVKGKGKGKESNFCCWGYYPLGFSPSAYKKLN